MLHSYLSFSSSFAYCKSYTQIQLSHISTQRRACYAHINTTDSEPRRTTSDPTLFYPTHRPCRAETGYLPSSSCLTCTPVNSAHTTAVTTFCMPGRGIYEPYSLPRKEPQAAKKLQLTRASPAGNCSAQRQQPVKCCHLPVSTASSLDKQGQPRRFHLTNWTTTAAGLYCSSMCPVRARYARHASALSGRAVIAARGASSELRPLRGHPGLLWGAWAGCRPRPGCTPGRR